MENKLLAFWGGFVTSFITCLALFALIISLPSCTANRPASVQPQSEPIIGPFAAHVPPLDTTLASLPPYLVPAPVGSTPRQQRQWQKAQAQNLARAGVQPTKIKNSSVATAPGAVAVNRPTSPVATGSGAATDARKSGTRGGSAAVGPGAVATSTIVGTPWWVYLLVLVLGAVAWELLTQHVVPLKWLPWRTSLA
jgi:hypothetical protein